MSDYFDRVERQLVDRAAARRRHRWWPATGRGLLVPAAAVITTIAVLVVFLSVGRRNSLTASPARGETSIVFSVSAVAPHLTLGPAINRSVITLRKRLNAVSSKVRVSRAGDSIVVTGATSRTRARILALAQPGEVSFYDWEANALTPDGKTVASQLMARSRAAVTVSQGGSAGAPGEVGAGGMGLYQAVQLAAQQPPAPASNQLSRFGPEYYAFAAPGSAVCAAVAKHHHTTPVPGEHCYVAGGTGAASRTALRADLPNGVSIGQVQQLVVRQGTVILQAANATPSGHAGFAGPNAEYFVLKDKVALTGSDITDPSQSTDYSGHPDVQFGFTANGQKEFQKVTGEIAKRGASVSVAAITLDQHFAVALDDQLLTVPQIDFKQYPDGIIGGGGADLMAGFTTTSARNLAIVLRYGPLAANLTPR